jgi:hypothetical protein
MRKGTTQDQWLRIHCPKLYGGVVLRKVEPQNIKNVPWKKQHKKGKRQSRSEIAKWGRVPSKKIRAKHNPIKVNTFMSKEKRKGKKHHGFKFNQTMDLAEWRSTHPNAA